MTRRRHFPSILQVLEGLDTKAWKTGIRRIERLHGDAILMPSPWKSMHSMAQVLAAPPLNIDQLNLEIAGAKQRRLGVFFEISLPNPDEPMHHLSALKTFQDRHIKPLMKLDYSGMLIGRGSNWPAAAILELERLVRLKEGAVLFIDHGRSPDLELLDGQVDGVVDPAGVQGITRFLKGFCSGSDLGRHLERQQQRLGINLAGRLLNPLELLRVDEPMIALGAGLAFMLRGYPLLPPPPNALPESIYGAVAQVRLDHDALEWGRFVDLSPPSNPDIFAFGRADERKNSPVIVIARRAAGAAFSLPLGVGAYDPKRCFVDLQGGQSEFITENGWIDLPACDGAQLLLLGQ
jgi:hypothetical protein